MAAEEDRNLRVADQDGDRQGPPEASPAAPISIAATLGRTACLVGMTVGLLALVRFWPPAGRAMHVILAAPIWPRLYGWLHVQSEIGREQILLIVMVLVCFGFALSVQLLALWIIGLLRRRKHQTDNGNARA
ncbi:hypothetical protein E3E11_01150 [Oecophyllibacter saccharovorans]|uniref:hypothetical protein n=1 Tax=Oecophyllibacter saccharovorans TaxID=2558360 RepID=UPI001141C1C4|nr:hypothetical protein [Oecophyllibacter saccharovorans]QDH14695.1 hypothetical protein E3E11_01150 [Oecophyllibacter saccharovorans]